MSTEIIPCDHPSAIRRALQILHRGGIIAFPTDTVYGVAAPAFSAKAVERLYFAKARDLRKAIPILIGELSQLDQVTLELNDTARRLAERFWPGALTLIVPRRPELPEVLSATPTVGVRMPNFPFTLKLLHCTGPLATTSANLSGAADPQTATDVLLQLTGRVDLILDGGRTPGGVPSTVVDCTRPEPVILRQGAISAEEITQVILGDIKH